MATDLGALYRFIEEQYRRPIFDQIAQVGVRFGDRPPTKAELDQRWDEHERLVAIGPVHHPLRSDFLPPGRWGYRHGELVRITPYLRGRGRRKCDCCGE